MTDSKPGADSKRFGKEDISDLAKFGSDMLKKTVSNGIDAFLDLKEGIPKEAASFINQRKDEIVKGLSKEMLQAVANSAVETLFAAIREHRLDISISVHRVDATQSKKTK